MNEITKGVLIGVICTAIASGVGYVLLVKENQVKINNIEKILSKYDGQMEQSGDSINALKLFVVSAHPDKDYMPIVSANKLQLMNTTEIVTLAASIDDSENENSWVGRMMISDDIRPIIEEHNLTNEDLGNYYNAVNASYAAPR